MRELTLPGKTLIVEMRAASGIRTQVTDIRGLGAVQCFWMILIDTRAAVEVYGDLGSPIVVERLDRALGRINEFITGNSIQPTSIEQLEKTYRARLNHFRHKGQDAEGFDGIEFIASLFETQPEEQFEREIDKLLSVPRLPAMDPCL